MVVEGINNYGNSYVICVIVTFIRQQRAGHVRLRTRFRRDAFPLVYTVVSEKPRIYVELILKIRGFVFKPERRRVLFSCSR